MITGADEAKQKAIATATRAYNMHQQKVDAFDGSSAGTGTESELANPIISTAAERPQPSLFEGKLKGYQLKVDYLFDAFVFIHNK